MSKKIQQSCIYLAKFGLPFLIFTLKLVCLGLGLLFSFYFFFSIGLEDSWKKAVTDLEFWTHFERSWKDIS